MIPQQRGEHSEQWSEVQLGFDLNMGMMHAAAIYAALSESSMASSHVKYAIIAGQ